jgi:hypothetical protein
MLLWSPSRQRVCRLPPQRVCRLPPRQTVSRLPRDWLPKRRGRFDCCGGFANAACIVQAGRPKIRYRPGSTHGISVRGPGGPALRPKPTRTHRPRVARERGPPDGAGRHSSRIAARQCACGWRTRTGDGQIRRWQFLHRRAQPESGCRCWSSRPGSGRCASGAVPPRTAGNGRRFKSSSGRDALSPNTCR